MIAGKYYLLLFLDDQNCIYLIFNWTLDEYPYHSTKNIKNVAFLITPACQNLGDRFKAGNLNVENEVIILFLYLA